MNWRLALGYGVMWGIAVSAMETFDLPLPAMSGSDLVLVLTNFLVLYTLAGVMLAAATLLVEQRLGLAFRLLLVLGFAGFMRVLSTGLDSVFLLPEWLEGSALRTFWITCFYGGLFVLARHLSVQAERTRGILAQAQIARQQGEASLGAARLQALQGHIDPAFLLRAMAAMQGRYRSDPGGTDRLLDSVVAFLRAAMPGVRSGTSSLAEEVALAAHYAAVCSELDGGRRMPVVRVEGTIARQPFPALMLLPLFDQLAAPACSAELRVRSSGAQCTLSLHTAAAAPCSLSADWLYRFQVGLRTLFGNDWTLAVGDGGAAPALLLTLPVPHEILVPATTPLEVSHG